MNVVDIEKISPQLRRNRMVYERYGMSHRIRRLHSCLDYDPYQTGLPADVDQQLSARYAELFEIFYRKRDNISRVTFWGEHDGASWKNNYPVPRRTNYPLLFDRKRQPKTALQAVLAIP